MAERIKLTQGYETIVDADQYDQLSQHKWSAMRIKDKIYAVTSVDTDNGRRKLVLMHRMITSAPKGLICYHVDGDCLNNTISNLAIITRREVSVKSCPPIKSGYVGVTHTPYGKWSAHIYKNGNLHHLGTHDTPDKARAAYLNALENL